MGMLAEAYPCLCACICCLGFCRPDSCNTNPVILLRVDCPLSNPTKPFGRPFYAQSCSPEEFDYVS